jgi:hypothetical protein
VRLFLTLWLVLFSVQASDLLAVVVPDGCTEEATGSADPCADACLRCICCARPSLFVAQADLGDAPVTAVRVAAPSRIDSFTDALPRGILHVPKNL